MSVLPWNLETEGQVLLDLGSSVSEAQRRGLRRRQALWWQCPLHMMPSVTARGNGRVHKPRTFLRSLSLSRWHTYVHTNSLAQSQFLSVLPRPLFSRSISLPLHHSLYYQFKPPPVWIPLGRQGRRLIGVCCWISWVTRPCWDNLIQNTTIMTQSTEINTVAPKFFKFGPSAVGDIIWRVFKKSLATAHPTCNQDGRINSQQWDGVID